MSMDGNIYFRPAESQVRADNFQSYWTHINTTSGALDEAARDLSIKSARLQDFASSVPHLSLNAEEQAWFERNAMHCQDNLGKADRKLLLLTCIYKFARHELLGIQGAWDVTPGLSQCRQLTDRISRMHLAEEFCHVRLFELMLRTSGIEHLENPPASPLISNIYRFFAWLPETLMAPLAFVTELMGMVFYIHLHRLFGDIYADQPEHCQHLRLMLEEIMVDELAHVGQRRNYLGTVGMKFSGMMLEPVIRMFFRDIPEISHLFDVDQMVGDARQFSLAMVDPGIVQRSWIPSYCQA
ncbi:MAG: hypothetical protein RIQ52_988 [Pseudomonadota bacterium]